MNTEALDWMAQHIATSRKGVHREQLLQALATDSPAVEAFIRSELLALCRRAAQATQIAVPVDFIQIPPEVVSRLKILLKEELAALSQTPA